MLIIPKFICYHFFNFQISFVFQNFKNEKVVYHDINERIVVISGSDSKLLCTKALEVMSFVDNELGFNLQNSVLPTTKKVYIFILTY